ncbi:hypothetical protein F4804DRAFT_39533 [Jackrogersella minutella]|nr:hypothetical protein F4804DRAFT_39533 [Jackrogersella minutella]
MPPNAPTPSLLLTKRLTAFLSSNLSPQIHTAVLTTLSGKLLAHASPHPVHALRTQCTVAASIWALYSTPPAAGTTVAEALPPPPPPQTTTTTTHPDTHAPVPNAVTIQLTGGVMVIRHLRCGLLFVCVGPGGEGGVEQARPMSSPAGGGEHQHHLATPLGSPSEVASVASAGAATTASVATTASAAASAVVAMRRQAEELARWLDDKLGSLGVLEEGLGIETR